MKLSTNRLSIRRRDELTSFTKWPNVGDKPSGVQGGVALPCGTSSGTPRRADGRGSESHSGETERWGTRGEQIESLQSERVCVKPLKAVIHL